MQILPSKELMPFIKHYLFLESAGMSIKKLRLFSDGNMGVVFSFKSNLIFNIQSSGLTDTLPATFVYGQINEFKDLCIVNQASLIIVVFHPAGLNQLLGIPASELRDQIINTQDLLGREGGLQIQERLSESNDIPTKLKILNTFFAALAGRQIAAHDVLINASVNFILKNKGVNSIHQLVKYTGYTERHIERVFIECIGFSPKKFGNIVRLHNFLKLLKSASRQSNFTTVSHEAGYSDQSHLIKEFRKYTGITPKEYLYKTNKLAVNFMEFPSLHSIT